MNKVEINIHEKVFMFIEFFIYLVKILRNRIVGSNGKYMFNFTRIE